MAELSRLPYGRPVRAPQGLSLRSEAITNMSSQAKRYVWNRLFHPFVLDLFVGT
jgi:hypothetical protein